MRHGPVLCGLLGAVAVAPFLTGPDASASRSGGDAATTLTVTYRGLRIPVPAGWRVYRLDHDPSRCVRYDHRAIYLGSPGPAPDCPARLAGGEDVLHVAPVPAAERPPDERSRAAVARAAARLARHTVRPTADHQVRLPLTEAGVTINGRYGQDPGGLQKLIRTSRLTGIWAPRDDDPGPDPDDELEIETEDEDEDEPVVEEPSEAQPSEAESLLEEAPEEHHKGRAWVKGKGFDTCTAPSLAAMRAWRPSFKVSNIYIGGAARGCAQPNLTRSWVKSVRGMGYRLVPTYVGLQAPCGKHKPRFTVRNADVKGKEAAVDAVRKAKALGIPKRKPIYFDMESYRTSDASCREAVMTFLHNWTVKIKSLRYVPGVYGSVGSVVRHLVAADDIRRPTALWFAHWNGKPALYGHPLIPDDLWYPHRRIKQYRGGHKETHGGVTIKIDSNQVDGRVY